MTKKGQLGFKDYILHIRRGASHGQRASQNSLAASSNAPNSLKMSIPKLIWTVKFSLELPM